MAAIDACWVCGQPKPKPNDAQQPHPDTMIGKS